MFQIMLLCIFSVLIFIFAFLIIASQHLGHINGNSDQWQNFFQFIDYSWTNYSIFILLITLAAMYITGALAIMMTHQIAGPVFRFLDILEKISKRDLSDNFKLRKNDHLKNIGDKIILLMNDMNISISTQRNLIIKLKEIINEEKNGKKINADLKIELINKLEEINYSYNLRDN
jgi:nitrogen fixation/metabolism regulation signal transduction histidine kinase